ncbi:MAG: MFS transporter [Actinobacteria bacterium]|nr:MFS transporter [Actinomycetota bacterium]
MTLAMSVWFSTAAVVPSLIVSWGISSGNASWLTSAVQVGFVAGALISALLNLADRVRIGTLIAVSAFAAAVTTALVPVLSHGLATAIPLRFLTGVALAGIYPAGTKLVASWFAGSRGLAMGILLAALTVGSASPHLVTAFGDPAWRLVLLITAGLALVGGVFALALEYGPRVAPPAPLRVGYVAQMFRDPRQRYVNLGYFGHMWELYAFWTWLPLYLTASFAAGGGWLDSGTGVSVVTFVAVGLAGAAGCVTAGFLALRKAPMGLARLSLLVSGACCALSPLVFGLSPALVIVLALIWGFFVISDSPMFSTALSQAADARYVGTALTAQMAIGFLITAAAIRVVPLVADPLGWRWGLAILAFGPAVGLVCTVRAAA